MHEAFRPLSSGHDRRMNREVLFPDVKIRKAFRCAQTRSGTYYYTTSPHAPRATRKATSREEHVKSGKKDKTGKGREGEVKEKRDKERPEQINSTRTGDRFQVRCQSNSDNTSRSLPEFSSFFVIDQ